MFRSGMRWPCVGAAVVVAGMAAGCGSAGPEIVPVSGIIKLDGQPLDQATILFVPEKGRTAVGLTDASGTYRLQFTEDRWGALPGAHKVMITTERAQSGGEGSPVVPGRKELLPKKYHAATELTAEVAADKKSIDFDLTSK
ncbi:hypothetical protein [Planctomyces sp. SH-PL14]|uniref:hypothetical protein n=1 Tax=Planctomyces sp. SH-PL14 TaxID=1632864 RepID=UPI00078E0567|nr:hypothetical protein [Planctomyces sp. SH-PL14]AMV20785.1 hypothetical protein VT03_22985 [Planctomyces sp. SH-PL14]